MADMLLRLDSGCKAVASGGVAVRANSDNSAAASGGEAGAEC